MLRMRRRFFRAVRRPGKPAAVKEIGAIPGLGLLTAVAAKGDARVFCSGREFAAWVGLAPGQTCSGGRIKLHGTAERGDTYLRTLLIHGARSVAMHAKAPGPRLERMKSSGGRPTWWWPPWPTRRHARSGRYSRMAGRIGRST
jgi:transposase